MRRRSGCCGDAGGGHPEGAELRPQHRAVLRRLPAAGRRPDAGRRVHGRCAAAQRWQAQCALDLSSGKLGMCHCRQPFKRTFGFSPMLGCRSGSRSVASLPFATSSLCSPRRRRPVRRNRRRRRREPQVVQAGPPHRPGHRTGGVLPALPRRAPRDLIPPGCPADVGTTVLAQLHLPACSPRCCVCARRHTCTKTHARCSSIARAPQLILMLSILTSASWRL